jgi:N-acetylmuramoyl-L-alanine amidase
MLMLLATGCAGYVSTSQVAARLNGRVMPGAAPQRVTIRGGGHEIVLESGTSLALIDGRGVLLERPTRWKGGEMEVSKDILERLGEPGPAPQARKRQYRLNYIVIDPGHGGRDSGASAGGVLEKDVNLDVALKLTRLLREQGMRVTLTRGDDRFISLDDRSAVANRTGADLFVSIHANACGTPSVRGIEVYYVSPTFTDEGRPFDDARRAAVLHAGYRPSSAWVGPSGMTQEQMVGALPRWRRASNELAQGIGGTMSRRLGAPMRGVKHAGFSVLKWTCAPSVLVETGYLTNPEDRRLLGQDDYRTRIARAIAEAVLAYRERFESTQPIAR